MFRISYDSGSTSSFPFREKVAARRSKHTRLCIAQEARRYFDATSQLRSSEDSELIKSLSKEIKIADDVELVSIIPCHAEEKINFRYLARHIKILTRDKGLAIVFLNSSAPQNSGLPIESVADYVRRRLLQEISEDKVLVIYTSFSQEKPIGAIRGIITDALLLAVQKRESLDPIVVSNDVDVEFTPENYASKVLQCFSNELLDVLTGPLYYGYSVNGICAGEPILGIPELLLANRLLAARAKIRLAGALDGGRFFATEGPHTAFRLSSYCAVGGYDYSMSLSEDDELGMALFRLRTNGENAFPCVKNAQYDSSFWLVTNARRQLRAIISGYSVTDTWVHYPIDQFVGHNMDLAALSETYNDSIGLLQIDQYECNENLETNLKLRERVISVLDEALSRCNLDEATLSSFCKTYGVEGVRKIDGDQNYDEIELLPSLKKALYRCKLKQIFDDPISVAG